jgi:REP element-mobilizing transposase RayT
MANDKWYWQESGEAWNGVGIYHITLTVPSREPLLGNLIIPDNDPTKAYVERTDFGKEIVYIIGSIPHYRPQIRLLQYCLMPDHVHFILYVQQTMPYSIKSVVRGFWQAAKKVGREYSILSISPNDIRENEQNKTTAIHPIFSEVPFIRPMSRRGQLDAMMQYVKMNPQRLATKRLNPGFFHIQREIEINGRKYDAVGNIKLLYEHRYMPVHVRRTMVEEAEHGAPQRLHDYKESCLNAARQGTIMVSPFISPDEQDLLHSLLDEKRSVIYLADNGFGQYYKPSARLFDAVDAGQMLILSPWIYDPNKKSISRTECTALNLIAEELCCL